MGDLISKAYMYGQPAVLQYANYRGPHRDYVGLTASILSVLGLVTADAH